MKTTRLYRTVCAVPFRCIGFTALFAFSVTAYGTTYVEPGFELEAGRFLTTANTLPAGTDSIEGNLSLTWSDIDMYEFGWGGGTFNANTVGSDIEDTELFLFNGAGIAIVANEDVSGDVWQSTITDIGLTAGNYYIAIARTGTKPYALTPPGPSVELMFDESVPENWEDQRLGISAYPLYWWDGYEAISPAATDGPGYVISILSTSAVPVPAAVWLFGSGLIGLVGIGRRKRAA